MLASVPLLPPDKTVFNFYYMLKMSLFLGGVFMSQASTCAVIAILFREFF